MSTRIPLIEADEQRRSMSERLEMSTAEIGLSVRTTNCLEERGIFTVQDLLNSTRDDLLSISNFGEKTLEEVYLALENIGFYRPTKQREKATLATPSPSQTRLVESTWRRRCECQAGVCGRSRRRRGWTRTDRPAVRSLATSVASCAAASRPSTRRRARPLRPHHARLRPGW